MQSTVESTDCCSKCEWALTFTFRHTGNASSWNQFKLDSIYRLIRSWMRNNNNSQTFVSFKFVVTLSKQNQLWELWSSSECYKTFFRKSRLPPELKQQEWAILNAIQSFGAKQLFFALHFSIGRLTGINFLKFLICGKCRFLAKMFDNIEKLWGASCRLRVPTDFDR